MYKIHTPCAVTADLNSYLSRLDEAVRRDEAIDERIEYLMREGSEYDPFSHDHIAEAISEVDLTEVAELIASDRISEVGAALKKQVRGYWEVLAMDEAERQIDNELADACQHCYGYGCRHCDEDYGRDD